MSGERRRRGRWFLPLLLLVVVAVGILGGAVVWEMRTSRFQAKMFSTVAAEISWEMEEGEAPRLVLPGPGPYDLRLGYHDLAQRIARAEERGFRVADQARVSERFRALVEDHGLFPIYREKTTAGLRITDRDRGLLYERHRPEVVYPSFESIPAIVWQTLLWIENRSLLDPARPYRNPAVEWARLVQSAAGLGLRQVGREGSVAGASTLATQLEKFRHSPDGLTETPRDKLRQMGSASLRAYLDGIETLPARRAVVLDYLNSVPLAAMPGAGEILGLLEGLAFWYGADIVEANRMLARVPTQRAGRIPEPGEILPAGSPPAVAFWTGSGSGEGTGDRLDLGALAPISVLFTGAAEEDRIDHGVEVEEDRIEEGGEAGGLEADMRAAPSTEEEWHRAALAYRQALSLLLAQRRPSYYLAQPGGRQELAELTDRYLLLLEAEGLVPAPLAGRALEIDAEPRRLPPPPSPVPFVERKAQDAVRTQLLGLLGVPRLYDLDRTDLTVRTSFDEEAQAAVTDLLVRLRDPGFVRERGLNAYRLLDRGDPARVVYSVLINEQTARGNSVRVQVDNLDAPFNLNESARLELGSTAKLRTLATYLQIIAEQHGRMSALTPDELRERPVAAGDRLAIWVRNQVVAEPTLDLGTILRRAMERRYSASPAERFVTGGGVQTFSNFDATFDRQAPTVREGFRHSVNLVFVRLMRDIVSHYMYRVPGSTAHVLDETDSPLRQEYLERFADREGIQFLDRFIPKYREIDRAGILRALLRDRRLSPQRIAWAYRAALPDGGTLEEFRYVLHAHDPDAEFSEGTTADLFRRADPEPHGLADLGYLASIHPLELWVARYLVEHPRASYAELIAASEAARQEVYAWLFRTRSRDAQDRRIRSLLEVEAFTEVLAGWQRLGYPFANIVPSLGTSIGSSGDRPAALNTLVGIILNGGVRLPTYRVEELRFAEGTPFETVMERTDALPERVMEADVAGVLREAMIDVVEAGTAVRTRGAVRAPDGSLETIGAKTGTGDNRYRVFAPGGRLLESRSVNRTSTLVFFVGDRHYGVITAYVPGEEAAGYSFTSSLPAQILRELAPVLEGLLAAPADRPEAALSPEPADPGA